MTLLHSVRTLCHMQSEMMSCCSMHVTSVVLFAHRTCSYPPWFEGVLWHHTARLHSMAMPIAMLHTGSGTEWFEAADYDSDAGQSYSSALESGPSLAAGIPEAEAEPEGSRLHLLLLQGLSEHDRQEASHTKHAGAGEHGSVCLALSYAQPHAGRAAAYAAGSGLKLRIFTEVGTL